MTIMNKDIYNGYRELTAATLTTSVEEYRDFYRKWLRGQITNKQLMKYVKTEFTGKNREWLDFLYSYFGISVPFALKKVEEQEKENYAKQPVEREVRMKKTIRHDCYIIDITDKYCYLYFGNEIVAKRKLNDDEPEFVTAEKNIDRYIKCGGFKHYLQMLAISGIKADRKDENVYLEYLSSEYVSLLTALKNKVRKEFIKDGSERYL